MTYQNGWTLVKGEANYEYSTISSAATFKARNPVMLTAEGNVIVELSGTTATLFGIACHDAATSLPGHAGMALIEVPTPECVYAIKIGTSATASEVSQGASFDLEKSGNYIIGNEDSCTTPFVTVVPRGDGSTIDSADSTVWVQILGDVLSPFFSNASEAAQEGP